MRVAPFIFVLALPVLIGCNSVTKQVKASAAPDSGFLANTDAMKEDRDRFPFNRVWVSPEFRETRDTYKKIILVPINTSHLGTMDWWQQQNAVTQQSLKEDAKKIAAYMQEAFQKAITDDPHHRFAVVTEPGPGTLKAEFALVELVPSKAFFNAATTVGGFFVPGVGMAASAGKGSVAIEGRITDSVTGMVLLQMADREQAKSALVDIAGLTWYDSSKESIDDWAKQFLELANTDSSVKVADSSPFTLLTW